MRELQAYHSAEIPAPSPEIYRNAAELVNVCGFQDGVLGDHDDLELDGRPDVDFGNIPCCINGHLMLALGIKPNYALYDYGEYNAIAGEVARTVGRTNRLNAMGIQSWNDSLPHSLSQELGIEFRIDSAELLAACAEREREILLKTAERLEANG